MYDILELGMEDDSHSNLTFISYTYDEMTSSKSEGRMNSLGNSYIFTGNFQLDLKIM